ncbi:MAG: septation ring formation regulator EzrA [Mollicutes bacterium]|nr:septation ring formation regulator EzrA [Mollicutes bacterium]MCI7058473.1 septation ring formation regulator EzrA [Mollicutes bacterium]MDD7715820.1 septation ring formation regulator EzrA [Mollicutes bacterium]MDY3903662.1 septation ring formation regulator EzrA [Candidatus Enteromonas sp.]MDY4936520.1 septation ring formation regulator EzrA [Candidatus Enteromonas sp.]
MKTKIYLSTPAIVGIVIGSICGAALIGILVYFLLFSGLRYKKQVRELSRRFEYLHALLFGQDSQYVKRIEIISLTNLLYVNTHMTFNKRFKDIRDKGDASAQTTINDLKDLLSDRDYKALKAALPKAKEVIDSYDDEVNSLNSDLLVVIKPEEECRQKSLMLKEELRKIKQDYYVKQADLTLVAPSFETVFNKLDDRFKDFESYVESAQYDDANNRLPEISKVLKELANVIKEMPNICVTIQSVIPEKLASLENKYEELLSSGYPLHHLLVKGNIEDMRRELNILTNSVQKFELDGVNERLDGMLAQIDDYFNSFEKEKDARVSFESDCDKVYSYANSIDKKYIRLCNSLPEVKKIYVISEEENAKIGAIKVLVNKAGATKRSLDTFIHSVTKQPYTILVEKMNLLNDESNSTSQAIDDFDRYLLSLKNDSEVAFNSVSTFDTKMKDAEYYLRLMDIPALNKKYQPDIDRCYDLLNQIYTKLNSLPIDVALINQLENELNQVGESVFNSTKEDYQQMLMANGSILFANRDRRHLGEMDATLKQAEGFYFSGEFKKAYDETNAVLKRIAGE